MVARILLAVLALAACAWFVLGIRQAHDLNAAAAIAGGSSITAARAAHAARLLNDAATLNPDLQVKLTRAQVAFDRGQGRRAIELVLGAARAEPQNALAWDELAKFAGSNSRLVLLALGHIRQLIPPVPHGH